MIVGHDGSHKLQASVLEHLNGDPGAGIPLQLRQYSVEVKAALVDFLAHLDEHESDGALALVRLQIGVVLAVLVLRRGRAIRRGVLLVAETELEFLLLEGTL